jgi:lysyl endopeptidase
MSSTRAPKIPVQEIQRRPMQCVRVLWLVCSIVAATSSQAASPVQRAGLPDPVAIRLSKPVIPAPASRDPATPSPHRFAVSIATHITPQAGEWAQLPDGRSAWRTRIEASEARSLSFAIEDVALPPGSELYVYGPGDAAGAPLSPVDVHDGRVWTPLVRASTATVEVVVPGSARAALHLRISAVNYGFDDLEFRSGAPGRAGKCMVDVACNTGEPWKAEARSVVSYTVQGQWTCSGTLVNNTARDGTPYVLTADHCVTTQADAASAVFYWNYQASTCGGTDASTSQSQSGADLVARSKNSVRDGGSDFALLRLRKPPDPDFGVYYAGWDRRDLAPSTGVVGIHHPHGDEKKISTSDLATERVSILLETEATVPADRLTHLLVPGWTEGAMEAGSSGSALWNRDRRVVGHYSAGASGCEAPSAPDAYGRLYHDWSGADDARHSVASWLDPGGTGAEVLDGLDTVAPEAAVQPGAEPAVSGGGAFGPLSLGLLSLAFAAAPSRRTGRRHPQRM